MEFVCAGVVPLRSAIENMKMQNCRLMIVVPVLRLDDENVKCTIWDSNRLVGT
jgi:hypothetical protein